MPRKFFHIGITTIVIGLFMITGGARADTIVQLQTKIDEANENRAVLEKEIANYQDQLRVINSQANTLQNTIKSLDVSASKITTQVNLTQTNLTRTTYTIQDTGLKIQDKQQKIERGNQAIKEALRQLNEADGNSTIEILLSNQSLSDFWNNEESIIQLQAKINDEVASVKDVKTSLEQAKTDLEQKKKELEDYTRQLADQKKVLQTTKSQKSTLLAETKNTETNYQKILNDKLALKEALDKEISDAESQLKLVIDPKSLPSATHSVLHWPLDNIYITQYFGKTVDSVRLYVSGTHNGIDFRAMIGTRVMSAGNGVVEGVGDTDAVCPGASYGKWVFIRYNNGLASIYGHLSVISAKKGQTVKTGEVVGYSGNTGYATGPHLHMGVFAGQGVEIATLKSTVCKGTYTMPIANTKAYLDPMIYLPAL